MMQLIISGSLLVLAIGTSPASSVEGGGMLFHSEVHVTPRGRMSHLKTLDRQSLMQADEATEKIGSRGRHPPNNLRDKKFPTMERTKNMLKQLTVDEHYQGIKAEEVLDLKMKAGQADEAAGAYKQELEKLHTLLPMVDKGIHKSAKTIAKTQVTKDRQITDELKSMEAAMTNEVQVATGANAEEPGEGKEDAKTDGDANGDKTPEALTQGTKNAPGDAVENTKNEAVVEPTKTAEEQPLEQQPTEDKTDEQPLEKPANSTPEQEEREVVDDKQ